MSLTPRARRALLLAGLMLAAVGLRVADWWDDRPDPEGPTATQVATREAPRRRLPTRFFNPDAVPEGDPAPVEQAGPLSEYSGESDSVSLWCALEGDPIDAEHLFLRSTPLALLRRKCLVNNCGLTPKSHEMAQGATLEHSNYLPEPAY